MRAFVTGGQGFVGSHLMPLLAQETVQLRSYDRAHKYSPDIRDYETLRTELEAFQPTHVFHLAAQAYVREGDSHPARALEVNTTGTLNLLEAVRHTVPDARVLLAGTSEEYGYENQPGPTVTEVSPTLPTTAYGVSKLAATTLGQVYAQRYGMHVVCTRAFNHTGPGQQRRYAVPSFICRALESARTGTPIRHGNLDAVRNWTDVRDVVRAYRLVIDARPGIYNVCSRTEVSMADVLAIIVGKVAGQPFPDIQFEKDPSLWHPSGSAVWYAPSFQKLQDATGWTPARALGETIRDMIEHERKETPR